MFESLGEIEAALAIVQKTLDKLTANGDHEAAYELARAQYTASLRASWPANLGSLVSALSTIAADGTLHLSEDERADVNKALSTLRAMTNL